MRVALDASPALSKMTGVGRYVVDLARALEQQDVDVVRYGVSWRGTDVAGVRRWRFPARVAQELWRTTGRPSPRRLLGAADVVHGTNFVLPPLEGRAGVVTIHDLWFSKDEHTPVGFLEHLVPWTLRRAHRVITPSRATADEIVERYGVAEDLIDVTHLGISDAFHDARPLGGSGLRELGVTSPFFLAVGTLQPRKNIGRLIEAWERAGPELEGWSLAVVGGAGWGPEVRSRAPGVVFLGHLDDSTLPGLTAAAGAFCFPSLEEGFGLPPLEAMATGTPAIVGSYPAARELVGEGALLVDPYDVDEIAHAMVKVASSEDVRRDLAYRGRAVAERFTWEATARATIDSYRRALESL